MHRSIIYTFHTEMLCKESQVSNSILHSTFGFQAMLNDHQGPAELNSQIKEHASHTMVQDLSY